jgi:hypothetical protein
MSPDGTVLFYAAGRRLYAIDLASPGSPRAIESTFEPDPWTQCVFADE